MKRLSFLLRLKALFIYLPLILNAEENKKANFIMIMVDDAGWGDLGCYDGGENRGCPTPNLDRMAAEGLRLTSYYGEANCTAGRAAFITGRQPIRTALSSILTPNDLNGLSQEDPTIAEALKKLGYQTAMWGKWHLGDQPHQYPTEHGFDQMRFMLPYYSGVYSYNYPTLQPDFPYKNPLFMSIWDKLNLSEWQGEAGKKPEIMKKKFGFEDVATVDDEIRADAVNYIKAHAHDNSPFFMYICFLKLHNPNNPSPRFKGKSPGGGVYLDSLMELDDNSGQILQAIRDAGIAENTMVVWTSDNGAWLDAAPDAGYTPFRGEKGTSFEGGFRCPALVWWPSHIKPGSVSPGMMTHMDWWPTFIKIAGGEPPSKIWKDNKGSEIVFDGIDNSEFILGKSLSKRQNFVYINDLSFGGVRVGPFKAIYSEKDTWLGSELNLGLPAIYHLFRDPGENFDMIFNGAGPTRGNFKTSPGRFSGQDHGWVLGLIHPVVMTFFKELVKYPNRPYIPSPGSMNLITEDLVNPMDLKRLFLMMEPSSKIKTQ